MGGGITFRRPHTYLSYGVRGSGKSSLLETFGENFLANGSPVIDLFGSRDGEGLAWCRSPWADDKKILLLHGDNTSVASSWDSKNISKYSLSDLNKYDIIISASPLYSSIDVEYTDVNRIIDEVYKRNKWNKVSFIIIREAANLLYSRMKISEDQKNAKASITYFVREARHSGFALGIDTQKYTSVDSDIRVTIDYVFFKSLGIQGLPDDLRWLYSYIMPFSLQRMPVGEFVVLTSSGSIGVGRFAEVPWHKREGEDILKKCGIDVEHGEALTTSKIKFRIGDLEHVRIVEERLTGSTYGVIAGEKWSAESIRLQLRDHNKSIDKKGQCEKCARAKSQYHQTKVELGRIEPRKI